jgi:hypothetical protein
MIVLTIARQIAKLVSFGERLPAQIGVLVCAQDAPVSAVNIAVDIEVADRKGLIAITRVIHDSFYDLTVRDILEHQVLSRTFYPRIRITNGDDSGVCERSAIAGVEIGFT